MERINKKLKNSGINKRFILLFLVGVSLNFNCLVSQASDPEKKKGSDEVDATVAMLNECYLATILYASAESEMDLEFWMIENKSWANQGQLIKLNNSKETDVINSGTDSFKSFLFPEDENVLKLENWMIETDTWYKKN